MVRLIINVITTPFIGSREMLLTITAIVLAAAKAMLGPVIPLSKKEESNTTAGANIQHCTIKIKDITINLRGSKLRHQFEKRSLSDSSSCNIKSFVRSDDECELLIVAMFV